MLWRTRASLARVEGRGEEQRCKFIMLSSGMYEYIVAAVYMLYKYKSISGTVVLVSCLMHGKSVFCLSVALLVSHACAV